MTTTGFQAKFFLLRAPLKPLDAFLDWTGADEDWEVAKPLLRRRLEAILEDPVFREALFLASPDLCAALHAAGGVREGRLERAVVRYFSRFCGRPTPFGLFAGIALGTVGHSTRLRLGPASRHRRHARLDMELCLALGERLASDPAIDARLPLRPNVTIHRTAGRYHYLQRRPGGSRNSYHLVAVERSEALEAVLARAATGATASELGASLVQGDIDQDQAEAFIAKLRHAQILTTSLGPALTGSVPLPGLIGRLEALGLGPRSSLLRLQAAVTEIADGPWNFPEASYQRLCALLDEVIPGLPAGPAIQMDVHLEMAEATLGASEVDKVKRGVEVLQHLFGAEEQDELGDFRDAFLARFDRREVPLLAALDEETGIGFPVRKALDTAGNPVLDGLGFGRRNDAWQPGWTPLHGFLLEKMQGTRHLTLTLADLQPYFTPRPAPLPDAFAALLEVAAPADAGPKVVLLKVGGPSGAAMLGRFAHGDRRLEALIRDHLELEAACRPEALFAEVVHLPESRVGNISLRPVLRSHEIAFLGDSGAPDERQIALADLQVSIQNGRIMLRSARLNREVLPRLSTAHNFSSWGLGLYRFLCHLQFQGTALRNWDWGCLGGLPFLPRLEVDGVVLAKARWRLRSAELKALGGSEVRLGAWRERQDIPRVVRIQGREAGLPVDLDNPLSVEMLLDLVNRSGTLDLEECWPEPGLSALTGPGGRYVHELVLPFNRVPGPPEGAPFRSPTPAQRRSFPPGSEWLYVKLYGGAALADLVLEQLLRPVVQEALDKGWMHRWFFVRYHDPEPHLRVRFRGNPETLLAKVLPSMHHRSEAMLADGLLWRVQLDTYERELERYGPEAIEHAEACFQFDSEAALEVLTAFSQEDGADLRWRMVLLSMHHWLDDLGMDMERRTALLGRLREASQVEFGLRGEAEAPLSRRFREQRRELEALLAGASEPRLEPGITALRTRFRALEPELKRLAGWADPGTMGRIEAILHMTANRFLSQDQRAQEALAYNFMHRIYLGRLARDLRA